MSRINSLVDGFAASVWDRGRYTTKSQHRISSRRPAPSHLAPQRTHGLIPRPPGLDWTGLYNTAQHSPAERNRCRASVTPHRFVGRDSVPSSPESISSRSSRTVVFHACFVHFQPSPALQQFPHHALAFEDLIFPPRTLPCVLRTVPVQSSPYNWRTGRLRNPYLCGLVPRLWLDAKISYRALVSSWIIWMPCRNGAESTSSPLLGSRLGGAHGGKRKPLAGLGIQSTEYWTGAVSSCGSSAPPGGISPGGGEGRREHGRVEIGDGRSPGIRSGERRVMEEREERGEWWSTEEYGIGKERKTDRGKEDVRMGWICCCHADDPEGDRGTVPLFT
jgi:hypothetical protein